MRRHRLQQRRSGNGRAYLEKVSAVQLIGLFFFAHDNGSFRLGNRKLKHRRWNP
jgi:hypothetical protein